ncbi:hypothetical protein IT084_06025 [Desulfallas sp. Bu1-1]|uniref:hypothetical protein n=1 Tax=Desulfallas sp. Bu1-1 TaxID=2787620 RepID=UPI00189D4023|nr:hypothetical protein [Desulfallas sp. Bu1-1]MBF7082536.1 hypothetical protein [Desulfallas sp. Bu1-1]
MSGFKTMLDRWFHPNREKQEQLQNRIQELQELSKIALEIGNHQIYRNLQTESNELLMKYLTYVFFDGLRFLVPHLFILAIITSRIRFIYLPVSIPVLGNEVAVVLVYPVLVMLLHILYKRYKKRTMRYSDCLN